MKRNLLFVSYRDGDFGQDLSYALDLAKMTEKGMAILLVNRKRLADKFDDMMTAVAFAEAGEHDTAIELMKAPEVEDGLTSMLEKKCRESGMAASVYSALHDAVSSLRDFLKQNNTIDMILLSPSITENGELSSKELKRLLRTASRPIVTMTRQAVAAA
jgi:arginine/ornithine N-succinyltransferase beta subunit